MQEQGLERRWKEWARSLRRWGLGPWMAALLEAAEPLWPLSLPLLRVGVEMWTGGENEALLALLGNPQHRRRFVRWLTEDET